MLKKVQLIMAMVSDMDRSIRFYRDVCGLPLKFQAPGWGEIDLGAFSLALHARSSRTETSGDSRHGWTLGFEVDDIQAMRQRLVEHGTEIRGDYHEIPGGVMLDFSDPDGYLLEMVQYGASRQSLGLGPET